MEFLSVCIGSRHRLGARSRRKNDDIIVSTIVSSPCGHGIHISKRFIDFFFLSLSLSLIIFFRFRFSEREGSLPVFLNEM